MTATELSRISRNAFSDFLTQPLKLSLVILFAICSSFYFWTAAASKPVTREPAGFFDLQTQAFVHRQIALLERPSPALLSKANPYDPKQNAGIKMHDALLYRDHYYMYWGVAPIAILYLPVQILTGQYIADNWACAFFASLGLFFYGLLLLTIRKDYFPASNAWVTFVLALLFAFGNMVPFILRRPSVYEVAITCAYFATGLYFYFVYLAAFRGSLRPKLLAAASLALGLVFLSRPSVAACGVALALAFYLYRKPVSRPGVGSLKFVALAWTGIALAVAAQASYNIVRFGSPVNYGIRYQLAAVNVHDATILSISRAFFSALFYLFSVPSFSSIFPFVIAQRSLASLVGPFRWAADALMPFVPDYSLEPTVGIVAVVPLLLLLLLLPAFLALCENRPKLRLFCLCVVTAGLLSGFVAAGVGPTMRYELDFLPQLLLGTAILVFWIAESAKVRLTFVAFAATISAMVAYTVVVSAAVSITGYDDSFRVRYPSQDLAVKKFFGPLEMLLTRPQDYPRAIRLNLRAPACGADLGQPLVVSGSEGAGDFILLRCSREAGKYLVGWDHWGTPTLFGPPFAVPADKLIVVEITAPSLFPPIDIRGNEIIYPPTTCAVRINGRDVFRVTECRMYDSNSSRLYILSNPLGGSVTADRYSGSVLSIQYNSANF